MSAYWKRFIREGEMLFDYMINNFDYMFSEKAIENFDIVDIKRQFTDKIDILKQDYYFDIIKEVFIWIKKEFNEGRLCKKELWKPFRDLESLSDCVLGYRIMFQYKQYYFQLGINSYNFIRNDFNNNFGYFELILYGWKNDKSDKLQPDNIAIISNDNTMPDYYWDIK